MAGFKQMMLTVCLGALVAGMFRMLSPGGGASKALRLTLGVFVLALFLIPLTGNDWQSFGSFEWQEFSPQTDWHQESLQATAQAETEGLVEVLSTQLDIKTRVLSVDTDFRDGQVFVEKICLWVEGTPQQAQQVSAAIDGYLDTEVSVVCEKGGD